MSSHYRKIKRTCPTAFIDYIIEEINGKLNYYIVNIVNILIFRIKC